MKILQITDNLGNGGAEKFIVELSNELSLANDVILCTIKPLEDWMIPPRSLSNRVKFISLNQQKKYNLKSIYKLWLLFKAEKPDVVHIHSSLVMLHLSFSPLLFRKIKFFHTIHNTITKGYSKLFNLLSFFSLICNRIRHICISNEIHKKFVLKYPSCMFHHIDNGINAIKITPLFEEVRIEINGYKTNPDDHMFVAIGNFSSYKRFDLLVDVFNYFNKIRDDLILIIIGQDPSKEQINFKKVLSQKSRNVHLLGLKANISDYVSLSDVLISSSSKEGMPLVILEALSLGKPIIATRAGGVINIVKDSINGYIAKDLTKESLIEAIENYLITSKADIEIFKDNNLEKFYKKYSIQLCAEKHMLIFKD